MKNQKLDLKNLNLTEMSNEELLETDGGTRVGEFIGSALAGAFIVFAGFAKGASESARQFDGAFAAH